MFCEKMTVKSKFFVISKVGPILYIWTSSISSATASWGAVLHLTSIFFFFYSTYSTHQYLAQVKAFNMDSLNKNKMRARFSWTLTKGWYFSFLIRSLVRPPEL